MQNIKITNESYQNGRDYIRIAPTNDGYFLIQNELNHLLTIPLKSLGYEIPQGKEPEKSVGITFSKYLEENIILEESDVKRSVQYVNNNRKITPKQYSNRLLGIFRHFLFSVYLKNQGHTYFKGIDKKSLHYINLLIKLNGFGTPEAA